MSRFVIQTKEFRMAHEEAVCARCLSWVGPAADAAEDVGCFCPKMLLGLLLLLLVMLLLMLVQDAAARPGFLL